MRYDKKNKKYKKSENIYFFDENMFRKILKIENFKKSCFRKKNEKSENVDFFEKSWLFENFDVFQQKSKKVTFWNFRFFKIFRKIVFVEKINVFGLFLLFIFCIVSHVLPHQVASRNSHCAARGHGKRPTENPENPENSCFWRFLGALFPYKLYRIFIKICESKKFDRFFCIEKNFFRKKYCFMF